MIDDATLAAWDGHLQEKDLPVEWLVSQFKRAIAEIRRLRESLIEECPRNCTTFQQYGDCEHRHPAEMAKLNRDLAAYRAVVRELAERIEGYKSALATGTVCLAGQPCSAPERDHRHWAQVEYLNLHRLVEGVAHPLVQQARGKA